MTMIDEEVVRTVLRGAADAFAVPEDAAPRIVAAARELEVRPGVVVRRRDHRRHETTGGGATDGGTTDGGPAGNEPLGAAPPRARRPKRVLVATVAAIALVGFTLAAVGTLGGSSSSSLKSSPPFSPPTTSAPTRAALGLAKTASGTAADAHQGATPSLGAATATTGPPLPTGAVGQASKVEETGSVELTVGKDRLQPVLTRLTDLAIANGGFAASTQTQAGGTGSAPSYGNITLQVPQASFGSVVDQVRTLGTVTSLSTKGTDVTGQYVDLQSRIGALQASRDQYLTIMSKATSISDILAVQNQLDSLQSQLEQLQGQLQVLDSQTTYSTLAVSVTENGAHRTVPPRPTSGIGDAWHGAVSGFAAAFDGLVRIAGPALFVVLCLVAVILFGRVTWRGVRRRTL